MISRPFDDAERHRLALRAAREPVRATPRLAATPVAAMDGLLPGNEKREVVIPVILPVILSEIGNYQEPDKRQRRSAVSRVLVAIVMASISLGTIKDGFE